MKEKLSKIRDALVIYGKADDGIIAFTKGFAYRGEKDENSPANKALTLFDSILTDLDSPELVEKMLINMINIKRKECRLPSIDVDFLKDKDPQGYDEWKSYALAAINAIKGE